MEKILVSYCLMGGKVRYHGGHAFCNHPQLRQWGAEGRLVSVCPEVAAGNSIPRPPSEIVGQGGGEAVIKGTAKITHKEGRDVTSAYLPGIHIALAVAKEHKIQMAILKAGSPSCGNIIYDGSFSGKTVEQSGVVAHWLSKYGIRVFNEAQIKEAKDYLDQLLGNIN